MKKKILIIALICAMSLTSAVSLIGCSKAPEKAPAPTNLSKYTIKDYGIHEGDIYVSTKGNDEKNDGLSKASPFATIERAQSEVRLMIENGNFSNGKITVSILAGTYYTNSLAFNELDSKVGVCAVEYCAYGDGEVVISGGINLNTSDFTSVNEADKARLSGEAKNNVKVVDLTTYGLTAEDWGKLYAVGGFHNASKYDGDTTGDNQCELFYNGERMNIARYPNKDYAKVSKVIDAGQTREHGENLTDWETRRNPRGGTFEVDKETKKRMVGWKNPTEAWVFGFFYWDWADASTPVTSINPEAGTVVTKYASTYGWKNDAKYYFYNVFEELDTDGEWYLDRTTGKLYLYASDGFEGASISMSLATDSVIDMENASNITLRGLTITDCRANAINIVGDNNSVLNCIIKNTAGEGISIKGYNNKVSECEIKKIGEGGITLDGGDSTSLRGAGNVADNNYVHDYGEIYKTYRAGISLKGVGNTASHNEIAFAPHMAIFYEGNNHLIEYNDIHDVVKLSSDAGAIYAGRSVSFYGNVIRYNAIYNIGSGEFKPNGIYFDDMLAGQTAYGNLLVNIPSFGFLIGGGKDNSVKENLIISAEKGVYYDDRGYEGLHKKGWYKENVDSPNGRHYKLLDEIPHGNSIWEQAYPEMFKMHADFDNQDDINFAVNPSGGVVSDNLIFSAKASIGQIEKSVKKYSTIENNGTYKLSKYKSMFKDYDGGDYTIVSDGQGLEDAPEYEQIPFSKIGRY